VQPTSVAGQLYDGLPNHTLSCEGDVKEADCKLRRQIPFTFGLWFYDPTK